ncbi:hypothetical protein B0H34DRAFT_647790 [Crassisporium funariophilum]|nr:hypothetical protein B0H34DRAFT_647790 [Crassisporium funariophilum]
MPNSEDNDNVQQTGKEAIHVNIPRRFLLVPGAAFVVGTAIGLMRGGRTASLRFLAENAHRPPKTVQGWYFYKKTKNYKVMLGALKGAGIEASRLSVLALGYVGLEEGMERVGWGEAKEVGAAVGTAAVFSAVYRLPMNLARRTVVVGLIAGGCMTGLKWGREGLAEKVAGRETGEET